MICSNCKHTIDRGVPFCSKCGFGVISLKAPSIFAKPTTKKDLFLLICFALVSIFAIVAVTSLTVTIVKLKTIPTDGVFVIEDTVLVYYNSNSATVRIPDGVTKIGEGAFSGCSLMEKVTIPDSVTKIDY